MARRNVLRELIVLLGVQISPSTSRQLQTFENLLGAAKVTMGDLASGTLRLTRNLALMAAAGGAALGKMTMDAAAHAVEIERQARLMLLTRQEYQQWLHVAQTLGATERDLADTMLQVNDASQRAIGGSKEMTEAFAGLGIKVAQLQGLNPGQTLDLMATQIEKMADRGKALGIVSRLLGEESGRKFGPLLLGGAGAIRAMRQEAERLGLVMSDDQLRAMKLVSVETRRLTGLVKGLRNVVMGALSPAIGAQIRQWREWLEANRALIAAGIERWVERVLILLENLQRAVTFIGGWDVVLLNVATGLGMLLLLANLDKVLLLIRAVQYGFGLLGVVAAALGIGLLPLTVILIGIAAALALVATAAAAFYLAFEDLWVWWQGGNSILGDNLDLLESLIPGFGAFRDLVWAVVESFMAAVDNAGLFVAAIRQGLQPALEFLDSILDRLLGRFRDLKVLWATVDEWVSAPLQAMTDSIRRDTLWSRSAANSAAGQLQGQLSREVQGQLGGALPGVQQVDNRVGGAISQVNNFFTPTGSEVGDALNAAIRQGAVATQGGRR
jgi:hypothetical protein